MHVVKKYMLLTLTYLVCQGSFAQKEAKYRAELELLAGEKWWGGVVVHGSQMPYGNREISIDLLGNNLGNQSVPLLLSNKGRYVWSEDPIAYSFRDNNLIVTSEFSGVVSDKPGKTLKEAYRHAMEKYFPPSGMIPDELLFTKPQYNTWIELNHYQNQEDIIEYARKFKEQGFPPGVLMIDNTWQEDHGRWEFAADRFHDPKSMMDELHHMGYKVMLWICPFVSPDFFWSRPLVKDSLVFYDVSGKPAVVRWWDGASYCLDLSNPKAKAWISDRMNRLVNDYGVDGFKLDAGDARFYEGPYIFHEEIHSNRQMELWAEIGLEYPLNEYRACWKMANQPLAQRLRDKFNDWEAVGKLIPDMIAQSMMGYAFTCADLIGGGDFAVFDENLDVDEEIMVRYAQVSALMPMMQFSVAPWRVLSKENLDIVKEAALLHERMGEEILALARISSTSGEPLFRPLEYNYPNQGYAEVKDQFMLGEDILVAPVTTKGARKRIIQFPKGKWKGDDGDTVIGPKALETDVPLSRLPWYRKMK